MKPLSCLQTSFLLLPRLKAKILRVRLFGVFLFPTKRLLNLGFALGVFLHSSSTELLVAATAANTRPVINNSKASNPSPLGAWQIDSASQSYAQNGSIDNVNPNTLSSAGSMFQEAFLTCSLGRIRQLGVADTKLLLQFLARRYLHTLLDPNVNHYLIEQYVCPSQLKSPVRWICGLDYISEPIPCAAEMLVRTGHIREYQGILQPVCRQLLNGH